MIPIHSNIGQGTRIHFDKLVNWYGKNELIPVHLENNIVNFYLSRVVKSTENQQCQQCSAVGERVWQNSALVSPTRDVSPIGDDIEPVGESRADGRRWGTLGSRNSQSQKESEESNEQRETRTRSFRIGHAVYRSWCAACVEGRGVGGQHRIELLEEEERERTTPIVAFDYGS